MSGSRTAGTTATRGRRRMARLGPQEGTVARQPIQLSDNDHITGAELIEEPEELGPLPTTAGSLLTEDALAARRFERGHLSRRVLIVGGNAGVTDQHCIMVLQNQCVLQYHFATSKPLKTRPAPDRCTTDRLCKPSSTATPFPLVAYDSRSVLAVKGPLRRVPRPGSLRADPKKAVYEGKGGLGFRAVSGPKGTFRPYQRLDLPGAEAIS